MVALHLSSCTKATQDSPIFLISLYSEPTHLNPQKMRSSSSHPLFHNLFEGLYKIDGDDQLIELGGKCSWQSPTILNCQLHNKKWSDGKPVTAADYEYGFQELVRPTNLSPRAHLLFSVKNAEAIWNNKLSPDQLGVKALSPTQLSIEFQQPDPQFLYKLSSNALSPRRKEQSGPPHQPSSWVSNGPYTIQEWKVGQHIDLKPNLFHSNNRILVRCLFVEDDQTNLRLYQSRQLDYVRRLPWEQSSPWEQQKDFHTVPLARFDYLALSGKLKHDSNLRQALVHSIDYSTLQKILKAKGRPGCPSLPTTWMDQTPCYDFDLEKAKKYLELSHLDSENQTFSLYFSLMGGEGIRRQIEFFQSQWQQNLGLKIRLQGMEQKSYLQKIKTSPPDIYRKGVNLDWPSCNQAFASLQQEPVALDFGVKQVQQWLNNLNLAQTPDDHRVQCRKNIKQMLKFHNLIPLGEIHFAILVRPTFKGWTLNSLNQLDLSSLSYQELN